MPLLICLKEPRINLIVAGEIKEDSEKEWDAIFSNGVLMLKNTEGTAVLVPLWKESNIAFIQEVTEEELEKQRGEFEKQKDGSRISKPEFLFPGGKQRR